MGGGRTPAVVARTVKGLVTAGVYAAKSGTITGVSGSFSTVVPMN